MTESIIDGLVSYFLKCPFLKDGVFRVDALGTKPVEYAIETEITTQPILTEYVDGSSVRQYLFVFTSREYYSFDRIENMKNSGFYEQLADWIEEQNRAGALPDLPEKCTAQRIGILAPGYMVDAGTETAQYQIRLVLEYFKEV